MSLTNSTLYAETTGFWPDESNELTVSQTIEIGNFIVFMLNIPLFIGLINAAVVHYYMKHIRLLAKRYPTAGLISIIQAIVIDICIAYLLPLFAQSQCCSYPFRHWRVFISAIGSIFGVGQFYVVLYRSYMIFFDIGFSSALTDDKWRSLVDSSDFERNWFVKYRSTFGNWKYVAIYFFCLASCGGIVLLPICYIAESFNKTYRVIIGASIIIPLLHFIFILIKLPKYNDSMYLRTELKILCIYMICAEMYFLAFSLILDPQPPSLIYLVMCFNYYGQNATLACIETYWVYWKCNLPTNVWSLMRSQLLTVGIDRRRGIAMLSTVQSYSPQGDIVSSLNSPSPNSGSPCGFGTKKRTKRVSLKAVLQSNDGLNLFCRHLTREFSIENMLFLMESQQFIDTLHETIRTSTVEPNVNHKKSIFLSPDLAALKIETSLNSVPNRFLEIEFSSIMPKSEIVNCGEFEPRQQIILIFEKFIKTDAIFCVNLSHRVRTTTYEYFCYNGRTYARKNEKGTIVGQSNNGTTALQYQWDSNKLLYAFNDARIEIWSLMKDTFSRFTKSQEFKQWIEQDDQIQLV